MAGRTWPTLTKLIALHLLSDLQSWSDAALEPRPGLFGQLESLETWCFVVGSFLDRRGVAMVDVVPLPLG